jgi:hypothetical protein
VRPFPNSLLTTCLPSQRDRLDGNSRQGRPPRMRTIHCKLNNWANPENLSIRLSAHFIIQSTQCDSIRYKYTVYTSRAGIPQSVQRSATGWTPRVRFPVGARDFSLFHSVQTASGARSVSYPMGTGSSFPGATRPGCEADHYLPCSAEVKNNTAIPSLPHTSSWLVLD